jgi:spermidine synthase
MGMRIEPPARRRPNALRSGNRVGASLVLFFGLCVSALACARTPPPSSLVARLLFDQTSPFGRVLVLDEGPLRVMRFGTREGSEQSSIVRDRPGAVPIEYVRTALLGLAHHGQVTRILMVGLGGGTFTTLVHRALPEVAIDVVEIDPVVVAAARGYFGLREDDRYRVHVADAVDWIGRDRGAYDYVLLDAYAGEEIPQVLRSASFFEAVARRLAPGGVVAINIAELRAEGMEVARAFRAVFVPFDCRRAPTDGNIVIFGAREPHAVDQAAMLRWLDAWDARRITDFSLRTLASGSGGADCARALSVDRPR